MFSNRDLRRLLIPLIFEQLLACLMGVVDTIMVTRVGDAAISAVSLREYHQHAGALPYQRPVRRRHHHLLPIPGTEGSSARHPGGGAGLSGGAGAVRCAVCRVPCVPHRTAEAHLRPGGGRGHVPGAGLFPRHRLQLIPSSPCPRPAPPSSGRAEMRACPWSSPRWPTASTSAATPC